MSVMSTAIPLWEFLAFIVAYYLFSSAVSAMERPSPTDSAQYRYWFRFLNHLAANWKRAALALNVPVADDQVEEKGAVSGPES